MFKKLKLKRMSSGNKDAESEVGGILSKVDKHRVVMSMFRTGNIVQLISRSSGQSLQLIRQNGDLTVDGHGPVDEEDVKKTQWTVAAIDTKHLGKAFSSIPGTDKLGKVASHGTNKVGKVASSGTDKVGKAASSGTDKVGNVASSGTDKVGKVASSGTDKVGKAASSGTDKVGKAASNVPGSDKVGKASSQGTDKVGKATSQGTEKLGKAGSHGGEKVGKMTSHMGKATSHVTSHVPSVGPILVQLYNENNFLVVADGQTKIITYDDPDSAGEETYLSISRVEQFISMESPNDCGHHVGVLSSGDLKLALATGTEMDSHFAPRLIFSAPVESEENGEEESGEDKGDKSSEKSDE